MSSEDEATERVDRHVLVLSVWLPAGLVAMGLFHYGFGAGGAWWVAAGFTALLAGFAGHVTANAALGTTFTLREAALGMVVYGAATISALFAVLMVDGFAARFLLPVAGGLIGLLLAAVFYMLTRFGTREAFSKFDIIRDNNPRRASRLTRPGARR